jgi:PAS domain S-box-containing protein
MSSVGPLNQQWDESPTLRPGAVSPDGERLLASITDHLQEAVYRSGPGHELIYVNPHYLQLFGYASLKELQAIPRERLYAHPEDRNRVLTMLKREGGFRGEEVEFQRKDGAHFWGLMSSQAIRDPATGEVSFHVGSITDVTARRQALQALRESEERFRRLFQDSADAMALVDPASGAFTDVNRAMLQKLGHRRREDLIGVRADSLAPKLQPDGRPSSELAGDLLRQALSQGSVRCEWTVARADGSQMPVETVLTAIETGEHPLLLAVSRDVSARRQAEAELRRLNQSLEDMVAERTGALQLSNELLREEVLERQRREKVEHALFRISEAIHLAENLERLFPLIHQAIQELMPARNFYIALHEPATDLHHFVYHVDERDPVPEPRRLKSGMTAYVFRTGRALLADRDSMLRPAGSRSGQDWSVEHGTPSAVWLGVPLVADGKTLGVMAVQDYHDQRAFGEQEKRLLTFIGEQTAVAIARKRAAEALRESEERHRALFEGSSQGVMLHDEHGLFALNPAALKMLGYADERELLGQHPAAISAPIQAGGLSAQELAPRHIADALEQGSKRFDWIGRRADGSEFPMEVTLTALNLRGRRILQAVVSDITERVRRMQIQRALYRISEAIHEVNELEELFPLIHVVVSDLMPADNFFIALADPATGTIRFPYWVDEVDPPPPPHSEARGLSGQVLRTGRSLLVGAEAFANARPTATGLYYESLGIEICAGIGSLPQVWLGAPLNIRGQTIGVMVVQHYQNPRAYGEEEKRILTFVAEQTALAIERKRAESDLRRALEREQELGRMKSNFTSLVSHEFRTPLGVIGSSAEILRDYFERLSPEERVEHVETIAKNAHRMGRMMEEVLLLSRFDAGKTEFQPRPIPLGEFCAKLAEEVEVATGRCCAVALTVADSCPTGHGDDRLLRHILTNLLVNAVKYSEPGRPVALTVRREEADAVFEVCDRGIGIPAADQEWIFEAFHRGSNVGHRPGTGLGLVIVKRCVELHGGQIDLESEVGQGTTVRVRLPMFREGDLTT